MGRGIEARGGEERGRGTEGREGNREEERGIKGRGT